MTLLSRYFPAFRIYGASFASRGEGPDKNAIENSLSQSLAKNSVTATYQQLRRIHTTESTTALPQPHSCRYNWLLELLAHTPSSLTISLRIEIGCFPRSVNDDFEGPCTLGGAAR